jgi:hypothetical protein
VCIEKPPENISIAMAMERGSIAQIGFSAKPGPAPLLDFGEKVAGAQQTPGQDRVVWPKAAQKNGAAVAAPNIYDNARWRPIT